MKRIYTLLILVVAFVMANQNDVKSQTYCVPSYGSICCMGFSNVQFSTINNNSGYGNGYENYYTSLSPAPVLKNTNYTLTFTTQQYQMYIVVWIDFNHNWSFDDAGEMVLLVSSYISPGTYSYSINIPNSATAGVTGMRLSCQYYGMGYYVTTSCGTFYYGDVEDYPINIVNPIALDAQVSAFSNPGPNSMVDTGVVTPIKVDIKNKGMSTLTSCTVNWDVDGVAQSPYSWTGSRVTDSIAKAVQIGTKKFTPGTHTLRAWTSSPNGGVDGDQTNDMCTYTFCTAERSKTGTYTIGPGGDFQTFADALSMMNCGILGPVVFNVLPYTFTERVVITPVKGASATNTVTFRGANKNNSILTYAGTSTNPRATVVLNGCKYIHFENMSITNTGANYATCVFFTGQAENNTLLNCILQVNNTYTGSYVVPVEAGNNEGSSGGYGNNANYNTIQGCNILGGYFGIYFVGSSTSVLCLGNNFISNTFRDQYYASIYTYYERSLLVQRNNIDIGSRYTSNTGIYSYYNEKTSIDGNIIKPGMYGIITYYENDYSTNDSSWIINNMISGFKTATQQIGYYSNYYNYNMRVYHNSIRVNGTIQNNYSNSALLFYYAYNSKVKNNILYCESGKGSLLLSFYPYPYSGLAQVDYNDYYYVGCNTAMFYSNNQYLTDLNAWKTSTQGLAIPHDVNSFNLIDPNFISSSDLHLQNRFSPLKGKNLGVMTDADGNARCLFEVTLGADESLASYSKPKAGFISEDTVCMGSPVTFINNAGSNEPKAHKWYVNRILRSSSLNLTYTFQNTGKDTVTLITTSCGGIDTFSKVILVSTPSGKPKADFISDVNIVETYWPVYLSDLSTGCPDSWEWSISPALDPQGNVTNEFILGTSNTSQNPIVWFFTPGKYKVCLKAYNNSNGTVDSTCFDDYIFVKSIGIMCQGSSVDYAPYGVLYDDIKDSTYTGPAQRAYCNYTINTCTDSLVLTFRKFSVGGNDYVRIYQGVDNTGIALWDRAKWPKGPGHNINIYTPGFQKTYVSKTGKMYIEWERAGHGTQTIVNLEGFQAEWVAYADSFPSPKADFIMQDTVCKNMLVNFENTSKGGFGDATYFWDYDGQNTNTSSYKDGEFTYMSTGSIPVKLKITDCGGSDSITKNIVVIQPSIAPTPDFSASILKPFAGSDNVTLIDESHKCVDSWKWTITPNTYTLVGTSTLFKQNPVVIFNDTGCYSIKLTAGYNNHYDSVTKPCYIRAINYCKPSSINLTSDVGISRVKVGTIDNYSSIGNTSYTDYTQTQSTYLELESTNDITVQRNTTYNATNRKVWIDYNIDGVFDPSELVASESNASTISWTASFKVPSTVTIGATRMRVGTTLATFPTNPCGATPYGEFEDYRIILRTDKTPPVITMNGSPTVNIEQCTPSYTDSGATAFDNVDGNITSKIVTTNNLNLNKVGSYWYHYDVTDAHGNVAMTSERIINITPEKVAPIIALKGKPWDTASLFLPYVDPGYIASDACSGIKNVSVSGTVNTNVVGSYTLSYTAFDSAGNHTSISRNVIVLDNVNPNITLNPPATMTLEVNRPYVDPGVTITDNYCTNLLPKINGNVDIHHVGTYVLTYSVTDCNGNGPVSVQRTINVIDTIPPVITYTGPGSYTIEVFDNFNMPYFAVKDNYCTANTVKKQGSFYTTFPNEKATVLGDYVAEYEVTDCMGNKSKFSVVVHVVDTEKPVILMQGPTVINICRFATINPADDIVTVTDNYDNIPLSSVVRTGTYSTDYLHNGKEGFYSITYDVSDNSGNKAVSVSRYINVTDCKLSVQEGLNKYVKIYPNPNNGQFILNIQLPTTNNINIIVTNTLGQIVKQINELNSSGNTYQLDLSGFGSGLYLIKVSTDNESAVFPVSVTR